MRGDHPRPRPAGAAEGPRHGAGAMVRVALSRTAWAAVAQELTSRHGADVPPVLPQRIHALLAEAPPEWPDQRFALELDTSSAEVVQSIHATLSELDPGAGQRTAALAEAEQIIRHYQQRNDRS